MSAQVIGSTFAGYRVVTELGGGGMGTVYFAEHPVIGRRAAIKILHPEVATNPEVVQRFQMEARSANEIRHPNVVEITDLGHDGGLYYIVMEFLEGETIGQRIERLKVIEERDAVRIVRQVASALDKAHERGIIHRDLKPENVFLTNHPDYPDFVKVLDFGIAKLNMSREVQYHTQSGVLMGTPTYMSPEQCRGLSELDHRSDIYALGVVLYEMVTGRPPFLGPALGEIIVQHVTQTPTPPRELNPQLSAHLESAIMRALEKGPERRFQTMRAFRDALEPPVPVAAALKGDVPAPAAAKGRRPAVAPTGAMPGPASLQATPHPASLAATPAPGAPPTEQEMRDRREAQAVVGKLSEIIANRIKTDRLVLPSMPGTALECIQILNDPLHSFNKVGAIIERDPLLAARIIRIANSAAFPSRVPADTVEQSIARMGTSGLTSALVEFSLQDAFSSRDERIQRAFNGIWEHSLATALLAKDLVQFGRIDGVDPQAVYLVGLLHDIGKPVVGSLLLEAERKMLVGDQITWMNEHVWKRVIGESHRGVGTALARKWNLPESIAKAVEQCRAYVRQPARCAGNVVCLANALVKREGVYVGDIDEAALEDTISLGRAALGLDDATITRLSEGLQMRVATLIPATARMPHDTGVIPPVAQRGR